MYYCTRFNSSAATAAVFSFARRVWQCWLKVLYFDQLIEVRSRPCTPLWGTDDM